MMNTMVRDELLQVLAELSEVKQREVLAFARGRQLPPGMPVAQLRKFAGTLTREQGEEMKRAIEEGCGQVDHGGW